MKKKEVKIVPIDKVIIETIQTAPHQINQECKHQNQGEGKCLDCNQPI